ncbi:virulence RhuM family protein [uncultured Thiodictyon sp.]|uniref:virulence RhuM family protein n=1 Tax=uncultured Thiodictyon sp. TaxID=1846217 RepID=UPI0025DE3387|nr:virulence RhuM family protein [uncultured Thiodictyon sp.]
MTDQADDDTPAAEIPSARGEILFYQTEDGGTRVACRFEDESVWLSQALMVELFQTSKQNISLHLKNVFDEGELEPHRVVKDYLITAVDGKVYRVKHYNLDAVIAVGYRIRSRRGTHFRQWATQTLREYLLKGFVMDDERLKNPPIAGSGVPDYFDQLLERIRDIRASERRMYLRVREIFAMAADYEPSSADTTRFFQTIQNKLHFAATGLTAPELIRSRADHQLPNMGLRSWKSGEVRKGDVTIGKNYLNEPEIDELNRIVVMWLDYAEDQARRRKQVFMQDWEERLDAFLAFNDRRVLPDAGKVTRTSADSFAKEEYEKFAQRRRSFKETEGERAAMQALEQLARDLPQPRDECDDGSEIL